MIKAFEDLKAEIRQSDALSNGEKSSLIAKLDSAQRKYAGGRPCEAADPHLRSYLTESERLQRTELYERGWHLRFDLLSSMRSGQGCPIGLPWLVDTTLAPYRAALADGTQLARIVDENGSVMDFAVDQLIVPGPELQARDLADKYGGQLLQHIASPPGFDVPAMNLLRVDPARGDLGDLRSNLEQLHPAVHASWMISSAAAAKTLSIAADEAAAGTPIALNIMTYGDRITGPTMEAETGPNGLNAGGTYNRDAYTWNHLRGLRTSFSDQTSIETRVTDAWRALADLGLTNLHFRRGLDLGVMDGGFDRERTRADLGGAFTATQFGPNDNVCSGGGACPWHGMNVASAAAARVDDSFGGAGPGGVFSSGYSVTGFDFDGDVWDSIGAFVLVGAYGIDVLNMSFSAAVPAALGIFTVPWEGYIEAYRDGGITMVASAGNQSLNVDAETCVVICVEDTNVLPCEIDDVICVGATEQNGKGRASYSNWGDQDVDVFAPGSVLVGPDPTRNREGLPMWDGNQVHVVNGTSFAAPFVSGVAMLMMAANPRFDDNPNIVESVLKATARPGIGTARRIVDAFAAVLDAMPTLIRILEPADGAAFPRGVVVNLRSALHDEEPGDPIVTWSSDRDGTLASGLNTTMRSASYGQHRITVTARWNNGVVASDSITVTVQNTPPTVRIIEPVTNSTFPLNSSMVVRGVSTDINEVENGGRLPDARVSWNIDGGTTRLVGHEGVIRLSGVPAGQHTLFFEGSDGTFPAVASITFFVDEQESQAPVVSITSPRDQERFAPTNVEVDPNGQAVRTYRDVVFVGRADDAQEGELGPATFEWQFSRDGGAWIGFSQQSSKTVTQRLHGRLDGVVTYRIRLFAADSAGHVDSDEITVYIDPPAI